MKGKRARTIWITLVATLLVIGLGAANAVAARTLKLAISTSPPDSKVLMVQKFAELVKAKTGGAIEISVYHSAQLGSDQQVMQGVRLGTLEMGSIGLPWVTSFAPEIGVLNLPYLFRDHAHAYAVLHGEIGQDLAKKYIEPHGLKVLGYVDVGFRILVNSKKVVNRPDDLKGLKIRTTGDPYHVGSWKAWGAMPVAMNIAEVYMALQTGTVDGEENGLLDIYAMKHYEVQKYVSLTNHAYTTGPLAVNMKVYQSLSPAEQKAFQDACKEAVQYQQGLMRQQEEIALADLKKRGLVVTDNPDREAFARMVGGVYDLYTKQHGTEYLEKIRRMQK
jgi:TRAP-type transport system periplasmic protein